MLLTQLDQVATAPRGVARLRELILTLAVQGKLVPQDPADEPASELLKRIRAEKDRLIAEGKIKRDKSVAPIAEEEVPFRLPNGWEWARLPDIYYSISPSGNKLLSSAVQPEGKHPVVDQGQRPIAGHTNDDSLLIEIPGPVIVFGDHTKEIKYIDFNFVAGADGTKILRPVQQDERFFAWQLRSFPLEDRGYARHFKVLNSCLFALPPLAEQSRIVTRVEELMHLCDALEDQAQLETAQHAQLLQALLGSLTASTTPEEPAANWQRVAAHFDLMLDRPEAVDALEQTILQLAVRGLLVPQDPNDEPASELLKKIRAEKDRLIAVGKIKRDKPPLPIAEDEQPFELPQGWQWVRFDELIHPLKPIAYGVLVPGPDVETGVPFVRIADLSLTDPPMKPEKSIGAEIDAQFQRTRLEGGEILMGVVGSIGKLGVAPPTWAGANIARAICRIVPADSGLNDFVLLLLQTQFMQESFAGDTRTLAQPTLNVGLIRAAMTPVPPPAEQSRIVTRVAQLRRLCSDLRQRLNRAQAQQALLAEALVQEVA